MRKKMFDKNWATIVTNRDTKDRRVIDINKCKEIALDLDKRKRKITAKHNSFWSNIKMVPPSQKQGTMNMHCIYQ